VRWLVATQRRRIKLGVTTAVLSIETRKRSWSVLIVLLSAIVVPLIFNLVIIPTIPELSPGVFKGLLFSQFYLLACSIFSMTVLGVSTRLKVLLEPPKKPFLTISLSVFIGLLAAVLAGQINLIQTIFFGPDDPNGDLRGYLLNLDPGLSTIFRVTFWLLPPMNEELLYRYIAQKQLEIVAGPRVSIMIVALLFSVSHLSGTLFVPILFSALIFGIAFYITNNWIIASIVHITHNLPVLYTGIGGMAIQSVEAQEIFWPGSVLVTIFSVGLLFVSLRGMSKIFLIPSVPQHQDS